MSKAFDSFRIEHVYREQNREADALATKRSMKLREESPIARSAKSASSTKSETSANPTGANPNPAPNPNLGKSRRVSVEVFFISLKMSSCPTAWSSMFDPRAPKPLG